MHSMCSSFPDIMIIGANLEAYMQNGQFARPISLTAHTRLKIWAIIPELKLDREEI